MEMKIEFFSTINTTNLFASFMDGPTVSRKNRCTINIPTPTLSGFFLT